MIRECGSSVTGGVISNPLNCHYQQHQQQLHPPENLLVEIKEYRPNKEPLNRVGLPFRQELHFEQLRERHELANQIYRMCAVISEQTLVN